MTVDINEHLAINVMGWQTVEDYTAYYRVRGLGLAIAFEFKDWNPPGSIEQAFMCAEQFKKTGFIRIVGGFDDWELRAQGKKEKGLKQYESTDLAEILSTAIAIATGWKEENPHGR